MKKFLCLLALGFTCMAALADVPPPAHLQCENAVNPFIDVREPRLSWKLTDPREGAAQKAYRVLVASSEAKLAADEGDLWDSGKVASDQSISCPTQESRCNRVSACSGRSELGFNFKGIVSYYEQVKRSLHKWLNR
jgi:hypothetical protein